MFRWVAALWWAAGLVLVFDQYAVADKGELKRGRTFNLNVTALHVEAGRGGFSFGSFDWFEGRVQISVKRFVRVLLCRTFKLNV